MFKNHLFEKIVVLSFMGASFSVHAKIQDSTRAKNFFSDRFNFLTNSHGVKEALQGKVKNVVIVDVRAAEDYKAGHIPGAINVPYDQFGAFMGTEEIFPGLTRDGYNYVYCYTETCTLAAKAAAKFASLGYPVKEMQGGFKEWVDEDNTVES